MASRDNHTDVHLAMFVSAVIIAFILVLIVELVALPHYAKIARLHCSAFVAPAPHGCKP